MKTRSALNVETPAPRCRLCGVARSRHLFVKGGTSFWRCGACGFRFATPEVNPNNHTSLQQFEESYIQYLAEQPEDYRNQTRLYSWMCEWCPLDGNSLLDVGCGSGNFVRFLRKRSVEAFGVEPSRALYDHFLQGDARIECGFLEESRWALKRSLDVVTALDVIEHVAKPLEFLQSAAGCLKEGGYLFVTSPDVGSVTARLLGRSWHFYHDYHLSYFSPTTLFAAATQAGFRVLGVGHRGRLRSVGYISKYLREVVFRRKVWRGLRYFDRILLPVNLLDVMYVVMKKNGDLADRAQGNCPTDFGVRSRQRDKRISSEVIRLSPSRSGGGRHFEGVFQQTGTLTQAAT